MSSKLRERMGVSFVVRWINFLQIWPVELTDTSIFEELRSGVLLCRILQTALPNVTEKMPLTTKTLTRASCLANLEEALSIILRQGGACLSKIATAEEIYNMETTKVSVFLPEMFRLTMGKELLAIAPALLHNFDDILRQFERDISGQHVTLEGAYGDGVRLMLILHSEGLVSTREIALMYGSPRNARERMDNCCRVSNILEKHGIPVLLDPLAWSQPVPECALMCQLYVVHEQLMRLRNANRVAKREAAMSAAAAACGSAELSARAMDSPIIPSTSNAADGSTGLASPDGQKKIPKLGGMHRKDGLKGTQRDLFRFRDNVPLIANAINIVCSSHLEQKSMEAGGILGCGKERKLLYNEDIRHHYVVMNKI